MVIAAYTGLTLPLAKSETETGFQEDLLTWPYRAMLSLLRRGYCVENIEVFSMPLFTLSPEHALCNIIDDETVIETQLRFSNIPAVMEDTVHLLDHPNFVYDQRVPQLDDIANTIARGGLAIINVNANGLSGEAGYAPHFVLVTDYDDTHITVNNPGLPACQDQRVEHSIFLKAWYYPDARSANITSIFQ